MRSSMAKAAGAFLLLLALVVFLASCGGGGNGTTGEEEEARRTGKGRHADLRARPGRRRRPQPDQRAEQRLDLHHHRRSSISWSRSGEGTEVDPGLATSWKSSNGGLTWTFQLREATFSNGEPVTGEDVKFSIERFADPKINTSYPTLGEAIKDVEVVDPHTVKINLKHVDGAFLDNIAMFAASIEPKKVVEEVGDKAFSDHPIGSGPVRGQGIHPRPEDRPRTRTSSTGGRASRT